MAAIQKVISGWFTHQFRDKKLNTPLGWILMAAWGYFIAYTTAAEDYQLTSMILLVIIGVFLLLLCLRHPLAGMYITIGFSCLFALPGRMFYIASPIGILVEVFTYILWIAVLGGNSKQKDDMTALWKHPITITFIIILIYYLMEIANPAMDSIAGWMFFIRKQISYILFYYICYVLLDSYKKMRDFLVFIIVLVLIIALYGIKQQWFGLFGFEKVWIYSDPLILELFWQGGFLRKFSFLTDPAAFGVICAAFCLFTLVLGMRTRKTKRKILLFTTSALCLIASSYSGSRTCNLMIVAGLLAYAVFTLNEKSTYVLVIASLFIGVFLLYGPFQNNPVIYRAKTTFSASKDASASIRDINRQRIQPYILTHPVGGGLNTSGMEGGLFNPWHPLANFPPDSGYMKILLEQGWIGFALHLVFYFLFLKHALLGFYKAQQPGIKNIYIALTICLFSLVVGQYSQVAIAQYPLILFYYASLVIIIKLIHYDTPYIETQNT
jgi:putative inorganic carbon (hco3(-)) transporter